MPGQMDELISTLSEKRMNSAGWQGAGFQVREDSIRRSAFEVLRLSGVNTASLLDIVPEISRFSPRIRDRVDIEAVYAPYVEQQKTTMRVFLKDESLHLPADLDYAKIHGLSMEEKALLAATKPESVGQARRIESMTPHGALRLLAFVKGESRAKRREQAFTEAMARKEGAVGAATELL